MTNQIGFVVKVFAWSAIASILIKFAAPYLSIEELSIASKNWIAGIAVTLPVVLYAAFLSWQARNN